MTAVITLTEVDVEFRHQALLHDVNLVVNEGECCALVGPNGTGKTVLLKAMCGLLTPTRGTVTIHPKHLMRRRQFPDNFGIIIDRPGFLASRSGLDNLRALAAIRGQVSDSEIIAAMEAVDLDHELRQPVGRYSMGMKQKLALAQATMEDQQVLILDEPFNALDADTTTLAQNLLLDKLDQGCTVVFTSHQSSDIDVMEPDRTYAIENRTLTASS